MKAPLRSLLVLMGGVALAAACSNTDVQPNQHYSTGPDSSAGAPTGGSGSDEGAAGAPDGAPSAAGAGVGATVGGADGSPGAGGSGSEEPPYDCVLHPKTHLEIINGCTDATRVEKHPVLPPLP